MLAAAAAALLTLQAGAWDEDEPRYEETRPGKLLLSLWGGGSALLDGSGRTSPWLGAEVGWEFRSSTLGLLLEGHRYGDRALATSTWTPVALARLEQHFETARRVEGSLVLGLGAGRPDRTWVFWYQFALGIRLGGDPFFVRAEVGFERGDFVRFGGGAGVAF